MKSIRNFFIISFLTLLIYNHGYYILKENTVPYDFKSNEGPYKGVVTYLINLDHASKRLEDMIPKVKQLGFPYQRINAVYGSKLSNIEIKEKFNLLKFLYLWGKLEPIGGFGCSLSHIKTWQTFLESNYEFALILEDDSAFDSNLLSQIVRQLVAHPEYWDINTFDPQRYGKPLTIKKFKNNDLVVYLGVTHSTTAYLISRHGAEKLLSKSHPMVLSVDRYFNRAWEFDLKFTGILPQLVFQNNSRSQITTTSVLDASSANISPIHYSLSYYTHKLFVDQTAIIRFLYNLKIYLMSKLNL